MDAPPASVSSIDDYIAGQASAVRSGSGSKRTRRRCSAAKPN